MKRATVVRSAALLIGIAAIVAGLWWQLGRTKRPAKPAPKPPPVVRTTPPARRGISGAVIRGDGQPVEGAIVSVYPVKKGATPGAAVKAAFTARTDRQGSFALPEVGEGTWRLDAQAAELLSPGPPNVRGLKLDVLAGGKGVHGVELVLRKPSTIQGKVVASGKPVADAQLGLFVLFTDSVAGPLEAPHVLEQRARTDADGGFVMEAVPPGRLRVLVEAKGYPLRESRQLYLTEGKQIKELVIDLTSTGALSGTVTSSRGEAIQATVLLEGKRLARSRRMGVRGGAWRFDDVQEGRVKLTARAPGYRSETVELTVRRGEEIKRELVLEPATGLFGRVVDSTGKGVPRAMVQLSLNGRTRSARFTDRDGAFEWNPPEYMRKEGGVWQVQAVSREHATSAQKTARLGEETTLEVGPGGKIKVRAVMKDGSPVSSYRVAIEDAQIPKPAPRFYTRTTESVNRADGTHTFASLRPGVYYLRASSQSLAPSESVRVEVRSGATSDVTLRLGAGATIRGRVVSEKDQKPISGAFVQVFEPGAPFRLPSAVTDADGRFTLEGVASGLRSLRVRATGYMTEVAAGVNVPTGGSVTRDLSMAPNTPGARFSFHGIGAMLQRDERGAKIQSVIKGRPAEAYGLKKGDVIVTVDREGVKGMRLKDVIERIRGEADQPVVLEVEREGEGRLTIEVVRGRVVVR